MAAAQSSGSSPNAAGPFASPPQNLAIDNTYGAIMLGTFGGLMLYGLTMHQGYRYVHLPYYATDSAYIKFMVAIVLVMETVHSILSMHACYYFLVTNYFQPEVLLHGSWSLDLLPMATGVVIAISQSFFVRRLYIINRKYAPLVVIVAILLFGELGLSTAATVEAFVQRDLGRFQKYKWMITAGIGMVIAADGLITALLTFVLHRSRTGFKSTDSVINVLIMYTINTGLLTGTISTISLFMALFYPNSLIDDGLNLCSSKLYATSLLAVLNSRHFVSGHGRSDHESTPSKFTFSAPVCRLTNIRQGRSAPQVSADSQHTVNIKITKEVVRDSSLDDVRKDTHERFELSILHPVPEHQSGSCETLPSSSPLS